MTGPYLHDGKVSTLEDAVSLMAEYQTGKSLNLAAKDAIVTWLRSLTGDLPAEYIKQPELPPSTARTPKGSGV
jgi:cytochrome c peroxidase